MQRQEWNSHFCYSLKSAQPLKAINRKHIFQMYWATFFADKLKLHDHYRGLDLNQLTFCPIKASLPLKLNILSSSPVKIKHSLATSHSYFHEGQARRWILHHTPDSANHIVLIYSSAHSHLGHIIMTSPEITISSIIITIIIAASLFKMTDSIYLCGT